MAKHEKVETFALLSREVLQEKRAVYTNLQLPAPSKHLAQRLAFKCQQFTPIELLGTPSFSQKGYCELTCRAHEDDFSCIARLQQTEIMMVNLSVLGLLT